MKKAVLLDAINPAAAATFEQAGFAVETFPKEADPATLIEQLKDADVLGIRSGPKLPAELLQAVPHLRAIGCYCVGTDQVDKPVATKQGAAIFNSPFDNGRSVAELVIGDTFSLMRRIQEHNLNGHAGLWTKTEQQSFEVKGKTMGIIGYGNIGQQVGVLAEAVGMNVVYTDIQDRPRLGNAQARPLDGLLGEADVVTVHVPGGEDKPVIGAAQLAAMKRGAYLINTARAQAVDYDALYEAVQTGHLAAAALDVFPDEPKKAGAEFKSRFQDDRRFLLTPHIGGSTQEAQKDAAVTVTNKLLAYCNTGATTGAVNLPQADLGPLTDAARLTYLHQNKPGAEAELTEALAADDINIVAQILRTQNEFGYGVYDLDIPANQHDLVATVLAGLRNQVRATVIRH